MIDLGSLFGAGGGAMLGFLGGVVQQRAGREARFEKRVDAELAALRSEVAECREDRAQFQIVKMGVCMALPELKRLDPENGTLKCVVDAFAALPPENEDFSALLAKLDGGEEEAHERDPDPNP